LNINKDIIRKISHPCAREICESWHEFRGKLYENDGNLYKGTVFSNSGIRNRMGDMLGGGNIFSAVRYEGIRENLTHVKVGELCNETGVMNREIVAAITGIPLTAVEYGKLRDSIKYLIGKYKPVWEMREKGKNIAEWIAPIKKESSKYRGLMSGRGSRVYRKFSFENIKPIKSLWGQLELDKDEILLSCCMILYNIREMDTELRQFIFRWHQCQ